MPGKVVLQLCQLFQRTRAVTGTTQLFLLFQRLRRSAKTDRVCQPAVFLSLLLPAAPLFLQLCQLFRRTHSFKSDPDP